MKKLVIVLCTFLICSCGQSQEEREKIAAVACSIMGETRNMDSSIRVREMNDAREKIGGEPFLGGDSTIKEAFEYGLCQELVLNETYDERLQSRKDAQRERARIAAEKQRIVDSKPSVKEEFHPNGELESITTYQSKNDGGKKHGLWEEYYASGQVRVTGNYKDGETDGHWVLYHPNGKLWGNSYYKDGKAVGLSDSYYDNGQLSYHTNYKDGKRDGLEEHFSKNGVIDYRANYKNGERDGLRQYYDKGGRETSSDCYRDGEKTDMSLCEK
jgi:antitoxin component YwqK of YwqJK toxin-antitoxin module